jgi:knotted carbamoyltransferase YgeW
MDIRDLRARIEALDASLLEGLEGRSLYLTREWSAGELTVLLDVAECFRRMDRAKVPTPLFPNELFLSLFFDASTRTRSSWAGAAARLGAAPVVFDGSATQVSHGETAEETGAMLGMNAHALGVRHDLILGEGNRFLRDAHKGILDYLAAAGDLREVPMVNLQCDVDHPTQALADLNWLRERFGGDLRGRTVAMSWAYSPSYAKPLSVPQGVITLFTRWGMNVRLAHPPGYRLMDECLAAARRFAGESDGGFEITDTMEEAFEGADIVYPKSWGPYDLMLERVQANRAGDRAKMAEIEQRALQRNAAHKDWICDERRMETTRDALYMHCLPADIGAEVTPAVYDRFRMDVARQANHKVYVIMALLAVAKQPDLRGRLLELLAKAAR